MTFNMPALVGSFAAQTVVVFASRAAPISNSSNAKLFGGLSNVEVGEEYTTLFMPARWAFAIWGVIYVGEVLAYGKILMGDAPAALEAAAPFLIAANVCQLLWALAFCFERLLVSTILMVGLAASMVIAALETYGADPVFSIPISLHAGWVCAAFLLNVNLANVQLKLGGDATTRQAIDLTLVFGSLYGATIIGAGVIALSGNVVLPLSIIWALVAIGVEAPNSPAGAKYTRAAVKYTALILAAKLAALAAFALKVGPEL